MTRPEPAPRWPIPPAKLLFQALGSVLLFGVFASFLILGLQVLRFPETVPVATGIFSPIPLSYLVCWHTTRGPLRWNLLARLLSATAAYFAWYVLLNMMSQARTGHTLDLVLGGTAAIALTLIPYFALRNTSAPQPTQETP